MARHEGDFRIGAKAPLGLDEFLALLRETGGGEAWTREDAIACYLSAGDGWREAMRMLGGAFADEVTELKKSKAD